MRKEKKKRRKGGKIKKNNKNKNKDKRGTKRSYVAACDWPILPYQQKINVITLKYQYSRQKKVRVST